MKKNTSLKIISKYWGWLLFFYSIPSKPVSRRMKIWRRLLKAGALQLKGAVYILPMNEEHYEFFQWLVSEVASMGGEAAFARVETIDSMKDEEIIDLFQKSREDEYLAAGRTLDDIEARVNSFRKGSKAEDLKAISDRINRVKRNCEEALKTDFFSSSAGSLLRSRLSALDTVMLRLGRPVHKIMPAVVTSGKKEDFQGKTWATRRRPFVDRLASAWLIRRFIDRKAAFRLMDEKDLAAAGKELVTFDVSGGMFTHVGDLCTFEVLVKSFNLKDRAVKKIAGIVHELDIRDDKYRNPETRGLEEILSGLRKAEKNDMKLLEKGISVFEMLYLSKTGG